MDASQPIEVQAKLQFNAGEHLPYLPLQILDR